MKAFHLAIPVVWSAALIVAISAPATAQQVVAKGRNLVQVTVAGQGVTEADATRDAMRKAIEAGAGTFISSRSEVRDFALIRDTILARAAGFVQSREIVSKAKLPDGTWQVKIRAIVSVRGIEDTWGAVTTLLQQMGRPKVMVFVQEQIDGERQDSSTLQTRIESTLLDSGFQLVDKKQIKAIDAKDIAAAVADDKPEKLQAIAKRFGAQLFITGTANATAGDVTNIGGVRLFPYQCEANIRTFRSDTAQLLSAIPGAPVRGVDRVWRSAAAKALDGQARQIAPRVVTDILRFWQEALAGRGEVQLHIANVTFRQRVAIKKKLETVKEIKEINGKLANKVAEFTLQCDVNAEALAEKLIDVLPNVEITDVSQNVIKGEYAEDDE